jgi:D-aminopeptidase
MNRKQMLELLRANRGEFQPGPQNCLTDVQGVRVGHLTINKDFQDESGKKIAIRTGLTAVVPCEMKEEKRLLAGFFGFRSHNEITGYEVEDDFCYLNSPLILSNSCNIGRAYNAILAYGFSLRRVEIWPPVVLGVDDSWLNDMDKSSIDENQIVKLLHDSSSSQVEEGSFGLGFGLRAFGWKGGIGTCSRVFSWGDKKFSLGVLAASNHGNKLDSQLKSPMGKSGSIQTQGSLILILAVDIPLVPFQIRRVTSSIVVGLPPVNTLNNCLDSVTCFLFSTANAMSLKDDGPLVFDYSLVDDSALESLIRAGAEATREAILRSLLLSSSVQGRMGRKANMIPDREFQKILNQFEDTT